MKRLSLIALLLLPLDLAAVPRQFAISNDGKSYAGFKIEDTFETVDGTTNKVSGTIQLDTTNLAGSSVVMNVDLASLDTANSIRDSEMRDTLETAKHPFATFKSATVSGAETIAPGQSTEVKVGGDFTLHGVTRRISLPVRISMLDANRVRAVARFTIRMTDFDIVVPDKLIVAVANEVAIRFDVVAVAK